MSLVFENKKCFIVSIFISVFLLMFLYGFSIHQTGNRPSQFSRPQHRKLMLTQTKRNSTDMMKMLPNAIIVGVRKGGTRALLRALSIHPDIHTASKEIHFFDRDENYAKGIGWYRTMLPKIPSKPGQIVMEKSPSYFVTPSVPQRIHKMSKSMKLLVVVRNPTKRAISDYTQIKSKNPNLPSFEKYITVDNKHSVLKVNDNCVDIGLYSKHLKKWLLYFPLNQIHFVSGEELSINPASELKAVEKFLHIKSAIHESDFVFNKTKGFPCFRKRPKGGSESTTYACLGATKGRHHPEIRKEVLDLLNDYYEPHNQQLYRMVNRDFGWNRK